MKKLSRKLLGIMLAVSMTVAAVFPVQSAAAGSGDSEYEDTEKEWTAEEEQKPSEEEPGERKEIEATEEEEKPSEKEEEQGKAKEAESTEEREQPSEESEMPEESDRSRQDSQIQEPEEEQPSAEEAADNAQPQEEPQAFDRAKQRASVPPQEGVTENTMPLEGSYDINQPVIESFELVENGQTLTKKDMLHFNMHVYDADSDIQSISVDLYNRSNYWSEKLEFVKSSVGNLYTAIVPCDQLSLGEYMVSSIRIEDQKNNYVDGKVYGDDGQYLYQFTLQDNVAEGNITLLGVRMEKNSGSGDETLKAGDSVTYTADIQCEGVEISSADMGITYRGSYYSKKWFSAKYDAESKSISGTF